MKKTIIFIQCRSGSTRFPKKILTEINGRNYIELLVKRIRATSNADEVVVITTLLKQDDLIENICLDHKIPFFRGSANDLLDRHYQANKIFKGEFVAKVPSDCPFSDPKINSKIISVIKSSEAIDYASNYHPPTFPDGLDLEIVKEEILEKAWHEAKENYEREHTFPYIWDNPEKFNIFNYTNKKGNFFKSHRWTLDYPEDLEFIKSIYNEFDSNEIFYFDDILEVLKSKPELAKINSKYNGVNWYRNASSKLKTIDSSLIN